MYPCFVVLARRRFSQSSVGQNSENAPIFPRLSEFCHNPHHERFAKFLSFSALRIGFRGWCRGTWPAYVNGAAGPEQIRYKSIKCPRLQKVKDTDRDTNRLTAAAARAQL